MLCFESVVLVRRGGGCVGDETGSDRGKGGQCSQESVHLQSHINIDLQTSMLKAAIFCDIDCYKMHSRPAADVEALSLLSCSASKVSLNTQDWQAVMQSVKLCSSLLYLCGGIGAGRGGEKGNVAGRGGSEQALTHTLLRVIAHLSGHSGSLTAAAQ